MALICYIMAAPAGQTGNLHWHQLTQLLISQVRKVNNIIKITADYRLCSILGAVRPGGTWTAGRGGGGQSMAV